ncbi:hypothetical protein Dimus_039328 [Dionaea muscipula]
MLVTSDDWDRFQPPRMPNPLSPTPLHLLSPSEKMMLMVCDAGIGRVPRLFEVVTFENLENHRIASMRHLRGTWAELRALYGETVELNGHPTLYEISSTEEEDEEEEDNDDYAEEGDGEDTD